MQAQRGGGGIATPVLNLGARRGGWSASHSVPSVPGKETLYPLYRRLRGPWGWSASVQKMSAPPRFEPQSMQSVANHYTGYAVPATHMLLG
jgi:hypothetical protein